MLTALALVLAAQTTQTPHLPPSSSVTVHHVCQVVEEALAKSDFAEARKQAGLLPKRSISIQWDDSGVPEVLKDQVDEMRDLAIKAWSRVFHLEIAIGSKADIAFRFVDHCADGPQGIPSASVLEFGDQPRLKVTIGLKRGKQLESIVPVDAYVQVAHAIGSYLGIADDPLLGSAMHVDDRPGLPPYGPSPKDIFVADNVLAMADQLRRDVASEKAIKAGEPALNLTPPVVDMGEVRQGSQVPIEFKVSNRGSADLVYTLVPDCGCFSPVAPGAVTPGQTATLRTIVNTTEYTGTVHKALVLYSNDPQSPAVEIPVTFRALPAYRLFRPEGDTVIVAGSGTAVDVLLTLPKDSKLFPDKFDVTGMDGVKVTMEQWHGSVPDPDLDEPSLPRQGYDFHIKVPGQLQIGRTGLTLSVTTSDKQFPILQYNLYLQKGIVALPDVLFLADMTGVMRASFRVSRHSKPFQLLAVETGSPNIKATLKPVRGQVEYEVDLIYDGLAPKGDFLSVVKVRTSDPKDPVVEVQVTGTVR